MLRRHLPLQVANTPDLVETAEGSCFIGFILKTMHSPGAAGREHLAILALESSSQPGAKPGVASAINRF